MKIALNEKALIQQSVAADFKGRARAIIEIGGLQLAGPGKLKFEIIRASRTIAESVINVNFKPSTEVKVTP